MTGKIKNFLNNEDKLYLIIKIEEEYSDEFGLFNFSIECHEYRHIHIKYFMKRARHRNEFILTYEQARELYPEYFI